MLLLTVNSFIISTVYRKGSISHFLFCAEYIGRAAPVFFSNSLMLDMLRFKFEKSYTKYEASFSPNQKHDDSPPGSLLRCFRA